MKNNEEKENMIKETKTNIPNFFLKYLQQAGSYFTFLP